MSDFICRVCGHVKCSTVGIYDIYPHLYTCDNCSVMFSNPSKFTVPKFKVAKLHEDAVIPTQARAGDAGYDLCSVERVVLFPREHKVIGTGLKFDIPDNYMFDIRSRSGLAAKNKVSVLNSPGTIDSQYVGELKVILYNASEHDKFTVNKGDRIAQLVISPVSTNIDFIEVNGIDKQTERGDGGFGHTG